MIQDYTAIDIETTGLDPKLEKMIEVGAVKVRNGQITDCFESLVQPGRKLSETITKLTGITDETLKGAPEPKEVIPKLLDFLGEDILLGHSIMFDYSFLKRAAVNLGFAFEKKGIDTLKIARAKLQNLESRRLDFLCNYYKIPHQAHRAMEDAKAASILYGKLAEEFYEERLFTPVTLVYKAKREGPITVQQKERLYKLIEAHKLIIDYDIDKLTRNEANRIADKIILQYGRLEK